MRNLFKYSKYYSGKDPEFIEGDIFRITVPLDDDYSFDFGQAKHGYDAGSTEKVREKYGKNTGKVYEKLNANQKKIIEYVENNGMITNKEAQKLLDIRKTNQCESAVQWRVKSKEIAQELLEIGFMDKAFAQCDNVTVDP